MSGASLNIKDQKVQELSVPDDFEKFLLPQRQIICGPSMSGNFFFNFLRAFFLVKVKNFNCSSFN